MPGTAVLEICGDVDRTAQPREWSSAFTKQRNRDYT